MLKKDENGKYTVNGKTVSVKYWNPCDHCEIADECDGAVQLVCQKNLGINECFSLD